MKRILFVCLGNICRSPMAEFVLKDLVRKAGREGEFKIESAATSGWEIGNPVYPPVRALLDAHGVSCVGKTARQLRKDEYGCYDLFIGMDEQNVRDMRTLFGGDPQGKVKSLLSYAGLTRAIADPWFTRDFEAAWKDIEMGCKALLAELEKQNV